MEPSQLEIDTANDEAIARALQAEEGALCGVILAFFSHIVQKSPTQLHNTTPNAWPCSYGGVDSICLHHLAQTLDANPRG